MAPIVSSDSADQTYARVTLNVPLRKLFDYRIPRELVERIRVGTRVRVPFGKRKMTGYVVGLSDTTEVAESLLKDIVAVPDKEDLLDDSMLKLTHWMADYYHCGWGEVLEAALPAGVRKTSRRRAIWFIELTIEPDAAAKMETELQPKSPAQARVLRTLLEVGTQSSLPDLKRHAKVSITSLKCLARAGVLKMEKRVVEDPDPLDVGGVERVTPPALTPEQQHAHDLIVQRSSAGEFGVVLLHGVTSSGKTEVYLQAIADIVAAGRQAIVLVPEISLTPQTVMHFKSRFERLAVLHSHLTDLERRLQWLRIKRGEADVVVGARSAIFAPVPRLGVVVVDEEQETSFKQESTPRYNARDAAVVRARQAGALVVLGSATPSLESYQNSLAGKYERVELHHRIGRRPMPPVDIVDMTHERSSGKHRSHISERLRVAMGLSLAHDEQVILFINRRGYAPHVLCQRCGCVLKCDRCDIPLSYHRKYAMCICHYCGREWQPPQVCPECANPKLTYGGIGTERIEKEIGGLFPGKVIVRMDSDSMKARHAHEEVLSAFRRHEIDVLVGTQMIAKGLDFPRVTTVGVIWADTGLYLPDFRARERTFQLIAQVAGRAGRGSRGGRVIVQTCVPDDPSIAFASHHDYVGFAVPELEERQEHGFPPFSRACRIVCQGKDEKLVEERIGKVAEAIEAIAGRLADGSSAHGPSPAPIALIKSQFRHHILITCPTHKSLRRILEYIDPLLQPLKGVRTIIDVDPMSMI